MEGLVLFGLIMMAVSCGMIASLIVVSVAVSKLAWRWALLRLGRGKTVAEPHILSLCVLLATGFPMSWPVAAIRSGAAGLGFVFLGIFLGALVHAAYRAECIRSVSKNTALAKALADVPYEGNRDFVVLETAREFGLPTFSGTTRLRAFAISAAVAALWVVIGLLVFRPAPVPLD